MADIRKQVNDIYCKDPQICCTYFEYSAGALEIYILPKICPRTNHLKFQLHHFLSFLQDGTIKLKAVPLAEKLVYPLTNPLPESDFLYLRKKLLGW